MTIPGETPDHEHENPAIIDHEPDPVQQIIDCFNEDLLTSSQDGLEWITEEAVDDRDETDELPALPTN